MFQSRLSKGTRAEASDGCCTEVSALRDGIGAIDRQVGAITDEDRACCGYRPGGAAIAKLQDTPVDIRVVSVGIGRRQYGCARAILIKLARIVAGRDGAEVDTLHDGIAAVDDQLGIVDDRTARRNRASRTTIAQLDLAAGQKRYACVGVGRRQRDYTGSTVLRKPSGAADGTEVGALENGSRTIK